ncbi:hypothetical protein DFP72DRAFT_1163499 [Ephemerocybe angulata]|uniref:Secreted protein n=1 Tax=Ephemerocybe angulata TaxID=980116 RepID=A0A8H6IHL0_9AGAR|nr:hypothetical protein DFP72DRAFT_1163499 [Tulosesus angulatus]
MKINCALVASLLIGVCDLLTGVRAYSDYNAELDARDNIDYLSTRDFAYDYQDLDAREPGTIEVPFDHSLRDFLGKAAAMHRRGLSNPFNPSRGEYDVYIDPPVTLESLRFKVEVFEKDKGADIKKRIKELAKTRGFILTKFTLKVGEAEKRERDAHVLADTASLRSVIPKPVKAKDSGKQTAGLSKIQFWVLP